MAKKKKSVLETMTETFPEVAAVPEEIATYDDVISEGPVLKILGEVPTPINVLPADISLEEEPGDTPETTLPEETEPEETPAESKIDMKDPESFSIFSRIIEIL